MLKKIQVVVLIIITVFLTVGCAGKEVKPAAVLAQPAATYSSEKLIMAGSGTNLPITSQLAAAYDKKYGTSAEVSPSIGTDGAILAVRSGALELGLISRSLTPKEAESGIKIVPYARIGIIFAVPPTVPDENMTFAELLEIYQGTKTTWRNGKPIVVIMREEHDSSNQVLYEKIPGWKTAVVQSVEQKRWQVVYTDADIPVAIRASDWSFGLTDSTEVFKKNSQLKSLRVNGTAPTLATIADGSYPLYKSLYFIYADPLTTRSKQFIDFVESAEGRKLIMESGGVSEQ